jgi:hypothetical protein
MIPHKNLIADARADHEVVGTWGYAGQGGGAGYIGASGGDCAGLDCIIDLLTIRGPVAAG